jgi:NAD+-dependent protein deacetylase SIR2
MKKAIDEKVIPKCPKCEGLVKPDIVFFGEALPPRFFIRREDMHAAGLSINCLSG